MAGESNLTRSSDVYIDEVTLMGVGKPKYNLMPLIEEISVFESVYKGFLTASIVIVDTHSVLTGYPIIGQEMVLLSFATPTFPRIRRLFAVHSVSHRIIDKGSGRQSYKLNLIAPEGLLDAKLKVSRGYNGTHDEIVQSIFNEYLSINTDTIQSKILIENTSTQGSVVIPNWLPSDAIAFLAKKSASKLNPNHAGYVFYQDIDSFNFRSMASLCNQGVDERHFYSYDYKNIRDENNKKPSPIEQMQKMSSFEVVSSPDRMNEIKTGMYAGTLYTVDITTKTYNRLDFDQGSFWKYASHLGDHPAIAINNQTLTTSPDSMTMLLPKNTHLFGSEETPMVDYNNPERWAMQRNSIMRHIASHQVKVVVPGDSTLRAGMVVSLEVPKISPPRPDSIWYDEHHSGKYLITSLRHMISNSGYVTVMECSRDAVSVPYDDSTELTTEGLGSRQ